jgi:hypothetical protein
MALAGCFVGYTSVCLVLGHDVCVLGLAQIPDEA